MNKMMYKALGLLVGVLGGMLASAIVRKVWEFTPGHDEAPEAIDTRRSWAEILTAAALLIATGLYAVIQALRSPAHHDDPASAAPAGQRTGRLMVTGAALSIDNLAVGFALGTFHINLAVAAVIIGAVSVTLSLIGWSWASRIGAKTGARGELLGGLVLIGVGAVIAAGLL